MTHQDCISRLKYSPNFLQVFAEKSTSKKINDDDDNNNDNKNIIIISKSKLY